MKKLLSLFLVLSPLLMFAQEVDADAILKINHDLSFIKKLDEGPALILVDRQTGEKINLFEYSRHRHGGTRISKEDHQLLFFSSFDEVGLESDISIYDLEKKERKDFFTEAWTIKELVWIDEHNLALKVNTISEEETEQVERLENSIQYLKATIIE